MKELCFRRYGDLFFFFLFPLEQSNNEEEEEKSEVLCENCLEPFLPTTILKHIGHVQECKTFYGPRFMEMKKQKNKEKVQKFQARHGRKNELKKMREQYQRNPEKKKKYAFAPQCNLTFKNQYLGIVTFR